MAAASYMGWMQVVVAMVMIIWVGGGAVEIAQGQEDCSSALTGLQTCLPYLQDGGPDPTTSAPPAECCSNLGTLLSSKPDCVCAFRSQLSTLNVTRAQDLVLACKVTIPASVLACLQGSLAPTSTPTVPTSSPPSKSPTIEGPSSTSPPSATSDGSFSSPLHIASGIMLSLACMYSSSF